MNALANITDETAAKFQSNLTSLQTYLVASNFREIHYESLDIDWTTLWNNLISIPKFRFYIMHRTLIVKIGVPGGDISH